MPFNPHLTHPQTAARRARRRLMLILLLVVCAGVALVGCRDEATAGDTCGAGRHQALIGQDRAAIDAAGLEPGPKLRILGPDDMATMDHRPDRLNIDLDADGQVTGLRCG